MRRLLMVGLIAATTAVIGVLGAPVASGANDGCSGQYVLYFAGVGHPADENGNGYICIQSRKDPRKPDFVDDNLKPSKKQV